MQNGFQVFKWLINRVKETDMAIVLLEAFNAHVVILLLFLMISQYILLTFIFKHKSQI